MLQGIPAPEFYRTDYESRHHEMHVDLMDVLSGRGASHFAGLGSGRRRPTQPDQDVLQEDLLALGLLPVVLQVGARDPTRS
mgnify:CR=1 FL=1